MSPRSRRYPRATVDECIAFLGRLATLGKPVMLEPEVVRLLGVKNRASGGYAKLFSSSRQYGLLEVEGRKDGRRLVISDLGHRLLRPADAAQERRDRLAAMSRPDIFRWIMTEFRDLSLPSASRLAEALTARYPFQLTRSAARTAADVFWDSASKAGAIDNGGYLRATSQLHAYPPHTASIPARPSGNGREHQPAGTPQADRSPDDKCNGSYTLNGRGAKVEVPSNWTMADVDWLYAMLKTMVVGNKGG